MPFANKNPSTPASIGILLLFFVTTTFAALPKTTPVKQSYAGVKASDILNFTAADFSLMTGKKMNAFQKISFKVMKIKLRKELKKNPDLLLNDFYKPNKKIGVGWIILITVLSTILLLFLIFAIAYSSQ